VFHISILGAWNFVRGLSPTKLPRGDGTVLHPAVSLPPLKASRFLQAYCSTATCSLQNISRIFIEPGFLNRWTLKNSQGGRENGSNILLKSINCIVFIICKFIIICL